VLLANPAPLPVEPKQHGELRPIPLHSRQWRLVQYYQFGRRIGILAVVSSADRQEALSSITGKMPIFRSESAKLAVLGGS